MPPRVVHQRARESGLLPWATWLALVWAGDRSARLVVPYQVAPQRSRIAISLIALRCLGPP
jgi:hypothetical protein